MVLPLAHPSSPGRALLSVNGYYCHPTCLPVLRRARARPDVAGRALVLDEVEHVLPQARLPAALQVVQAEYEARSVL